MANLKISEMAELAAASLDPAVDYFPIVDPSEALPADQNKRILAGNLAITSGMITRLGAATTPLAGTETLPISASGAAVEVTVANLTSGRSVDGSNFVVTATTVPVNGIYLPAANTFGIATNTTLRLSVSTTAVTSTLPIDGPDGAVTAPTFTNTGDLNTGMYFSAADTVDFAAGGVRALQLLTTASAVNYFKITPCTDGNNVELEVDGTSTDIGMDIHSKGAANILFRSGGGTLTQFGINSTASASNHLRVTGSNGGAPQLLTSGGSSNIDIQLTPTGTGGVLHPVGAVATPGISFTGDADTGIWHSAADTIDFSTEGARQLQIENASGATAYLGLTGGAGGNGPAISARGSGTNLGLTFNAKGSEFVYLRANSKDALRATASSGADNRLVVSSGSGTVTLEVEGQSGGTAGDLVLTPLGTGRVRFGTAAASVATPSTHKIEIKAADGTTYYLLATT